MKVFTSLAAFAALASAATVTLKETDCITRTSLEEFTIEVDKLVVKDLPSVCGLRIVSASGVDVTSLSCRAFKDAAGTDPGSAFFNSTTPALISTNPVQEGSIRCNSTQNGKLKDNSTMSLSTLTTAVASTGTSLPVATGNITVSGTRTPTPSSSPTSTGTGGTPSPTTNAAAQVGMSVFAVVGAFALFVL